MKDLKKEIRESIDNLPPISQVLKDHKFYTKKNLGQNFIFDLNVTSKIVSYAAPLENNIVVEVGPGAGSLTREILKRNPHKLYVIEKDKTCLPILEELKSISQNKMEILNEDALNTKYSELAERDKKLKIIANLPYNVGTELYLKWLNSLDYIDSMTLMFQKEVAERITAKPSEAQYSRLSVISNLICNSKIMFEVPPTIFFPPPKVYSAIIHSIPKIEAERSRIDLEKIKKLTRAAFGQKRKTIRNSLKPILDKETDKALESCNINPKNRAENLSPEDFLRLCDFISN